MTFEEGLQRLSHPLYEMCKDVITDIRFIESPASQKHHHAYRGGLYEHTLEVMNLSLASVQVKDFEIMITASIFHDRNKIFEYFINDKEEIEVLPYASLEGHIVGSFIHLLEKMHDYNYQPDNSFIKEVGHILLSHHGRKEWGSPVEPMTRLSFLFHAADMCSARGCII